VSTDNLPARPAEPPLLPDQFDDQLRARLAALDAASDTHAADQRPDNTTRAYAAELARNMDALAVRAAGRTNAESRLDAEIADL
jgi:hypothetical protein